jgi:dTDP-4-amino-4,6-dideoxygalactose transaminase
MRVSTAAALAMSAAQSSSAAAKPAILGGTPVRTAKFPSWPVFGKLEESGLLEVLRSGHWYRGSGSAVDAFEKEFATMMGSKNCLATANGTSALIASMGALGVGPGDEVLLPPYTCVASLNAILVHYALPVFCDTDIETSQIDHTKLEHSTSGATKAIMPVHLGGNVANMDAINKFADARSIAVIEDACQAHLAEWRGKRVGTLSKAGCFSFQASKNLNSGEGGAVLSDDDDFIERAYTFHNNGRGRRRDDYDFSYRSNGANLRLTEFQGALLSAQMSRVEKQTKRRDENTAYLTKLMGEIDGLTPAKEYDGTTRNAFHLYMLRYDPKAFKGLTRSRFIKAMREEGVSCGGGYSPLPDEPFYEARLKSPAYKKLYGEKRISEVLELARCPQNRKLCTEAVWFTQTMFLGPKKDMDSMAEAITKIQKHAEHLLEI